MRVRVRASQVKAHGNWTWEQLYALDRDGTTAAILLANSYAVFKPYRAQL